MRIFTNLELLSLAVSSRKNTVVISVNPKIHTGEEIKKYYSCL